MADSFDKIGKSRPETTGIKMPVQILQEKSGYLYVEAAGGWSAWTRQENVIFTR